MIRRSLRDFIDRRMPALGHAVRARRRARRWRQPPVRTPYGFMLVGNPLMAANDYEPDEIAAFLRALQRCDACVDVGANIGYYSCLAATHGVPVIAIEPHPDNQQ